MTRAVFLDRDNTIIHNDGDLGDPEAVKLIQGTATAIASLCGLGYKIVVVTNQGGVARGKYTEDDVLLVHERIAQAVREAANGARIDRFYYCPYHPEGTVEEYRCEHSSRKPNPGMILEAAGDMNIDLSQSWTIGDAQRDVEAGHRAGTRTILLTERTDEVGEGNPPPPDYVARNLTEAVRIIAHARRPEAAEHLQYAHRGTKRFDAAAVAKLQQPRGGRAEGDANAPPHAESDRPSEPEAKRTAGKPFRPWSNMPMDEGEDPKEVSARVRERFRRLRAEREGRPDAAVESPLEAASEREAAREPAAAPPTVAVVEAPAPPPEAAPAPSPVEEPRPRPAEVRDARDPSPPWASMDQTLRLVLQELRNQRGTTDEFSYLNVVAIVLQLVAAVCLLGGLWMGSGNDYLFLRWIGAGVLVQLATIAALMFGRRR